MLWQGAPQPWALALTAFRVRAVAIYFAALMAWRAFTTIVDGGSWRAGLEDAVGLASSVENGARGDLRLLLALVQGPEKTSGQKALEDRKSVVRAER